MRAVAALAVVLGHVYAFSQAYAPSIFSGFGHHLLLGGGLGVFLFFILSGYLLYWPFAREAVEGGSVDLLRYGLNRAVRILPLYYVVLAVVLLLQHDGGSFDQWWKFGLFGQNFFVDTSGTVDGPMWSLAVEIQFYVALPFIALGITKVARGSLGVQAALLGVLWIASFAVRYVTVLDGPIQFRWQYSLPSLLFFFVTGMLLAVLRLAWERRPPGWLRGALGRSDVWLLASVPFWLLAVWRFSWEPAIAAASFLMCAACVLPLRDGLGVRALEWKPLAVLGVASYSIYLWHVPMFLELTGGQVVATGGAHYVGEPKSYALLLFLGVPLACIIGVVSYRLIESPFLRLRKRWARPGGGTDTPSPIFRGA